MANELKCTIIVTIHDKEGNTSTGKLVKFPYWLSEPYTINVNSLTFKLEDSVKYIDFNFLNNGETMEEVNKFLNTIKGWCTNIEMSDGDDWIEIELFVKNNILYVKYILSPYPTATNIASFKLNQHAKDMVYTRDNRKELKKDYKHVNREEQFTDKALKDKAGKIADLIYAIERIKEFDNNLLEKEYTVDIHTCFYVKDMLDMLRDKIDACFPLSGTEPLDRRDRHRHIFRHVFSLHASMETVLDIIAESNTVTKENLRRITCDMWCSLWPKYIIRHLKKIYLDLWKEDGRSIRYTENKD